MHGRASANIGREGGTDSTACLLLALAACAACAACVEPKADDKVGAAKFVRGLASLDSDYDGAPAGAGLAPNATAGMNSLGMAGNSSGAGAASGNAGGATGNVGGASGGGALTGGTGGNSGAAGNAIGGRGGVGGGAGAGGAAGATSAAGEGAPSPSGGSAGMLKITFTTVDQNGRYAPANVGAIWIEDGSGKFIKTIKRWAGVRASHLTAWKAVSGGWPSFFGGGNAADQMDAISAGTMRSHGMHDVSWDMKDPMGQLVPDGAYKVGIECTEDNRVAGANAKVDFTKGAAPMTVMPPDEPPYAGLTISYQP